MRIIFSILLIILSIFLAEAQKNNFKFEKFSIKDGLSQGSVLCIEQDKFGYLWFGTEDGLNRFDGERFVQFYPEIQKEGSISDNFIYSIVRDSVGDLWIGTRKGLNRFDYEKQRFEHFVYDENNEYSISNNDVLSMFIDSDGIFWVGTRAGLCKVENYRSEPRFIRFQHNPNDSTSLCHNHVWEIVEDSQHQLWLGTDFGVSQLNKSTLRFTNYLPSSKNGIKGTENRAISIDSDGDVWIGSCRDGISILNPKTQEYSYINSETTPNIFNAIRQISRDENDNIWIATRDGLVFYNDAEKIHYSYYHKLCDAHGLSSSKLNCIFIDRESNYWFGTDNGVSKLNLKNNYFKHIRHHLDDDKGLIDNWTWAIEQDSQESLYIGTANGFTKITKDGEFEHHKVKAQSEISQQNEIRDICVRQNGEIWIATWGAGLYMYVDEKNDYIAFRSNATDATSLPDNFVSFVDEDSDGNLWVGTRMAGVCMFNDSLFNFRQFPQKGRGEALRDGYAYSFFEDSKKRVWIGTRNGLNLFDKENDCFKVYGSAENSCNINNSFIRCINEDAKGRFWVGTSGGLYRFYPEKEEFEPYTFEAAAPINVVYGILDDSNDCLWISTNNGILRFVVNNTSFHSFTVDDGLQGNEFNGGAYFKDKNGKMYFGGTGGLTVFHPDSVKPKVYDSQVVITSFVIFNQEVQVGDTINEKVLLNKTIEETETIILGYDDYLFTIGFSSLSYSSFNKKRFAYKLEGFDTDWIITNETQGSATYTNLSPGKYVFEVKGINHKGVWDEKGQILNVIIVPPFWKRWWFLLAVSLFVIMNVVLYIKLRERGLVVAKKKLEQLINERTREVVGQYDEIKRNRDEIQLQQQEIEVQRDEIKMQRDYLSKQNDQIISQNKELELHRLELEKLVRDRTEDLIKAKEKAEESDRLKTSFLANMSHEIRTPMNAIIGFSQLLAKPMLNDEQRKEFVKLINDSSESLLVLIDDILDVSKIEANQLKIKKTDVNLSSLLLDLKTTFTSHIKHKNKQIDLVLTNPFPHDGFYIVADSQRLKQVINNLLSNALKYTEQGEIEFGVSMEHQEKGIFLKFFVRDTGIGLPHDMKEKVFDRFMKVENNNRRIYRGAGLGLAICKRLVHLFGGEIWVESVPAKGSTFFFTLLFEKGNNSGISFINDHKLKTAYNWKNKKVLIVEDDHINYRFLEVGLRSTKIDIFWAKNGVEGVSMFNENSFDIVLMDIQLPEMDGIEATRRIKKMQPQVPIIAQTAFALSNEKESIYEAGCDAYIPKPIIMNKLLNVMSNYLS